MDIRRLVNRIADALGPDATPDRVEAIAEAVLQELSKASDAPPNAAPAHPFTSDPPGEHAIITAYGVDHPGIMAGITNVVSGTGCNILDVSQKILQGYFTLIMLTDISSMRGSIQQLQQQLADEGDRLDVRIMVQHEELFNAMHRP